VRELLVSHDATIDSDGLGPRAEIAFWSRATAELDAAGSQLARLDVARALAVLHAAGSSYHAPFQALAARVAARGVEAASNVKFMGLLREPCDALALATPTELPAILPELLSRIRVIWSISKFYNTEERLTALLRKLSSEIISRGCASLSVASILGGDVEGSLAALAAAIEGGEQWKAIYRRTVAAIARTVGCRPWTFDEATIFAEADAFVQRCRDLTEVCRGQQQFQRKSAATGGAPGPLPVFGGSSSGAIGAEMARIQGAFEASLAHVASVTYDILDVKSSGWHHDFEVSGGTAAGRYHPSSFFVYSLLFLSKNKTLV
jgi:dynein heavy chain